MPAALKKLPLAVWIIIGLAVGAIVGLILPPAGENPVVDEWVGAAAVGGQAWLQALQMTILPLVFALLTTLFIRSQGLAGGRRTTRRAFTMIILLYLLGAALGIVLSYTLLGVFPVTADMATAMRAMAGEGVAEASPPWAEAVLALVPSNIIAAMAGGSLLPVLFFALLFGAALAKLDDGDGKRTVSNALLALSDIMFIIVRWILALAPLGVALLILPTTQRHGADIFAGLAHWIALNTGQTLLFFPVIYLLVAVASRVPAGRFAREIFPAQTVAFGTQSSTGTMPITIAGCRRMGISESAIDATVPLSAVLFRIIAPASAVLLCMYAVDVYQMAPMSLGLVIGIALLGALLEMSFVGIPGGAYFIAYYAPLAAIVGFPIEFVVVLMVVETIPDIAKTVLHVTTHAATAAMVDRGFAEEAAPAH